MNTPMTDIRSDAVTGELIAVEEAHLAHNYPPLPVVVARGAPTAQTDRTTLVAVVVDERVVTHRFCVFAQVTRHGTVEQIRETSGGNCGGGEHASVFSARKE